MPQSYSLNAIVLKTYNVGEADRYCVLFTREKGRLAVRAAGVRKTTSRMGGSLLMPRHVQITVKESSAGWIAANVQVTDTHTETIDPSAFADVAEGIEVLLRLTQDDEPLPRVFDATLEFLRSCRRHHPQACLIYQLCVLHLLGLLPGDEEMQHFFELSEAERVFIAAAREGHFFQESPVESTHQLERLRDKFLQEHLSGPLKAPRVTSMMRGE